MVKRGSGYLRQSLMNVSMVVIANNHTFYDYFHKKMNEGKAYRVENMMQRIEACILIT